MFLLIHKIIKLILSALLLGVFSTVCYPQSQKYNPKVSFAIETYAFLKGQSAALEKISRQFPSLKAKVQTVEQDSKISFVRAQRNIEHFLEEELTVADYEALQKQIDSMLQAQLKNPIEKEKFAIDFLNLVSSRSQFIAGTLVEKGVLSFAYHDTPHQEITDGHFTNFTTKHHPKADRAALKVPIPKSWLAEEAEMPQTIQQFTSHYGNGEAKIVIVVYDLSQQPEMILNEKSITQMIPPESRLIRTDKVQIDGIPAMMIEAEQPLGYPANEMKIRMLQFMFIQNQKLYCLQGSIGPVQASNNLDKKIKKYEPLFRLVASNTEFDH